MGGCGGVRMMFFILGGADGSFERGRGGGRWDCCMDGWVGDEIVVRMDGRMVGWCDEAGWDDLFCMK